MIEIRIANNQDLVPIDESWFEELAFFVLRSQSRISANLSIAFVDDRTIHRLNRQYLAHDYPTDVLTFPYSVEPTELEGEIVISAEYAQHRAPEFESPVRTEIGLYLVHGILHLCGYDDQKPSEAELMRERQEELLRDFRSRKAGGTLIGDSSGRSNSSE